MNPDQPGQKYLRWLYFLEPQRGEDVQDQDHVTGGGGQGHEKDQEDDPGMNWHFFSSFIILSCVELLNN